MKTLRMAAGAALMSVSLVLPVNATTFDFFWTGNPLLDPNIVSSNGPSASAMGTLDINVPNGDIFSHLDISHVNIDIKGDTFTDFTILDLIWGSGSVSGDGSSAVFTEFFSSEYVGAFGCPDQHCGLSEIGILMNVGRVYVSYQSPQTALASFQLTSQPSVVPVPAALPLLGSGLALMGWMGWRRKKSP